MALPSTIPASSPPPGVPPGPDRLRARRRLLVALLLGLGALLCVLLFTRRPPPAPVVPVYTPRQAQAAQAHVDAVREQFTHPSPPEANPPAAAPSQEAVAFGAAPARPAPGPRIVRLQLTQGDLNAYLATNPHVKAMLAQKRVQAVQLILHAPRGLTLRATVLYRGKPQNVQIEAQMRVAPGKPFAITATGAQVGRLPIPPALVTVEANKVAAQMTGKAVQSLALSLQSVRVVGDRLVLTGVARAPGRPPRS